MLTAVLHRSQHRPGSTKQAQTWPYGSNYSIVQGCPRLLKSDQYVLVYGVPKWRPKPIFPLIIEILSRDSLLARTQDRQESATERPFTGGPSRSPRQARRQHNLVTPGRSGRRGGVFLRNGVAPGPPGGRLRSPAGAPSVNIKLFTRRLASLQSVSWSRTINFKTFRPPKK